MIAIPVIVGRVYRVKGPGIDLLISAAHPCDAINIASSMFGGAQ